MARLDGVIVIKDEETRSHVKAAAHAAGSYLRLYSTGSLDQALVLLKVRSHFDVIFLSNKFEDAYIEKFAIEAKRTNGGCNAPVVLVGEQSLSLGLEFSEGVKKRIVGFLDNVCQPDDLVSIAEKVRVLQEELSPSQKSANTFGQAANEQNVKSGGVVGPVVHKERENPGKSNPGKSNPGTFVLHTTRIEGGSDAQKSRPARGINKVVDKSSSIQGVTPIVRTWDSQSGDSQSGEHPKIDDEEI